MAQIYSRELLTAVKSIRVLSDKNDFPLVSTSVFTIIKIPCTSGFKLLEYLKLALEQNKYLAAILMHYLKRP